MCVCIYVYICSAEFIFTVVYRMAVITSLVHCEPRIPSSIRNNFIKLELLHIPQIQRFNIYVISSLCCQFIDIIYISRNGKTSFPPVTPLARLHHLPLTVVCLDLRDAKHITLV